MKKSKKLIILFIITIFLGGSYYIYTKDYFNKWFDQKYQTDEDGNRIFSDEEIAKYDQYMKEAHEFMVAADAGNPDLYNKAAEAYKKASDIGDNKFWNPLLGLASAYRKLEKYNEADIIYDKALIAANYNEGKIYQEKIDMYRYEMKKSNNDIKKIYQEGIEKVTDNANLVLSYCAFSESIKDYTNSINCYKLLLERFPGNQSYIKKIETLKVKLEK